MELQCRLCSSGSSLISLFRGKNRSNRDYIRKLVYFTTGIKFQQNDSYKCVCYPCTIQIYNFYMFRTRSLENEQRLQKIYTGEKLTSNKLDVAEIDNLDIPKVKELASTLAPWLVSKCCKMNDKDRNETDVEVNNECANTNDVDDTLYTVQSYNSVEYVDKEIQSELSSVEVFTQTSNLVPSTSRSDLIKTVKWSNKNTQYDLSSTDLATQTNNLSKRAKKTQCELLKVDQKALRCKTSDSSESFDKETQYDLTYSEVPIQTNNLLTRCNAAIQTDGLSTRVKRTQCELLKDHQRSMPNLETNDSTTQTDAVDHYDSENDQHIDYKDDIRDNFVDVKYESPSVNSMSPPVLTSMTGLNIRVDYHDNTSTPVSPAYCTSPVSSNLLTVKNKSHYVIICPTCDQSLYTKNQYKLHIKSHMVCNFCKKKFRSLKRTKLHLQNECSVRKLTNTVPVVTLVRLETMKDVKEKYPDYLEVINGQDCKPANVDVHKSFRMRSRSTSSTESFYSNCRACQSCFSLLHQLSIGVDKSIQTSWLFDTDTIRSQFVIKRKLKDSSDNEIPCKKSKISL